MGVSFGAEGEIPSARFCARRQAPGQRTVRRTVLTLRVCPFRISFFTSKKTPKVGCFFGAEGEIRTLASVSRPTPLAGAPRHQLEYFCV